MSIHRMSKETASSGSTRPQVVTSRQLLENSPELVIEHLGQEYRLRITRQGKLILTK